MKDHEKCPGKTDRIDKIDLVVEESAPNDITSKVMIQSFTDKRNRCYFKIVYLVLSTQPSNEQRAALENRKKIVLK